MKHSDFIAEQYNGKRVALIGGSGQVGSYMVPLLKAAGAKIEIFDRETSPFARHCQSGIFDVIANGRWTKNELERFAPDYVINLAAKVTGVTYNETAHFEMALYNALVQILPLWMCEHIATRFVQFSTVCVLPHDAVVPTAELPIEELGLPEPSNLGYGLAKQFGEWLCKFAHSEKKNLSVICLRPSNLYGRERPDDPHGHVIPRFTWRLLHREDPMVIRGLPTTERSFLHAEDCASAALTLAATSYRGTVNVPATAKSVSMQDLLHILSSITEWTPRYVEWGSDAQQGYARREADPTLFHRILMDNGVSWCPQWTLQQGLHEYVLWSRQFMDSRAGTIAAATVDGHALQGCR